MNIPEERRSFVGRLECCGKKGMSLCGDCPKFARRIQTPEELEAERVELRKSLARKDY